VCVSVCLCVRVYVCAMQLPPEVEAFFDTQRHEQRTLNTLAVVQGTLTRTGDVLLHNMCELAQRGNTLNHTEEASYELEQTSRRFYILSLSRWQRFLHLLKDCQCWKWCCCCFWWPLWWWDACCPRGISRHAHVYVKHDPFNV
jgi:hypothetical protein